MARHETKQSDELTALFTDPQDAADDSNPVGFNLESGQLLVSVALLFLGGSQVAAGIIPRITTRTIIASGVSLAVLFFILRFLPENIKSFFRV